jgi:hypothetical protein
MLRCAQPGTSAAQLSASEAVATMVAEDQCLMEASIDPSREFAGAMELTGVVVIEFRRLGASNRRRPAFWRNAVAESSTITKADAPIRRLIGQTVPCRGTKL